jgi:5'-nucleotidase
MEGSLLGLPAVAFSNAAWMPKHLAGTAATAQRLMQRLIARGLTPGLLLNVNLPDVPTDELKGIRATRLGRRVYRDVVIPATDPRGRPYYWIGGDPPVWEPDPQSDFEAIAAGCVSVTPLRTDWTAQEALEGVGRMARDLETSVVPQACPQAK